jgi:hypothetical protein
MIVWSDVMWRVMIDVRVLSATVMTAMPEEQERLFCVTVMYKYMYLYHLIYIDCTEILVPLT